MYLDSERRRTLNLTANVNTDRNVTDSFITRVYRLLLSVDLLLRSVCELPQELHRWIETGGRSPSSSSVPVAEKWVHASTALETINSKEMQEHSTASLCPYSQALTKTTEHFIKVCTGNKVLRIWKLETDTKGGTEIYRNVERGMSTNGIILRKLLARCWLHTPGDMRVKVVSSSGTE